VKSDASTGRFKLGFHVGIRAEIGFAAAGTLTRTDLKSRRVRDERPKG
jgi:hypothetical protein